MRRKPEKRQPHDVPDAPDLTPEVVLTEKGADDGVPTDVVAEETWADVDAALADRNRDEDLQPFEGEFEPPTPDEACDHPMDTLRIPLK